jgi:sortase B
MFKTKKMVLTGFYYIFTFIFILTAILVVAISLDRGDTQKFRKKIVKDENQKKKMINPIDWKKLKNINHDVYAWIMIPGTEIDYAVAAASHREAENFYLSHNIFKNYKFSGMIFSQKNNSKNFSDPVTVLYGHNMRNGSMFGGLNRFLNINYFRKYKKIYIYMPGKIYVYKICAAGEFGSQNILQNYDFSDGIDSCYIKKIKHMTLHRHMLLKKNDHMLTLSTCASIQSKRRILQAVLIHKYKNW